MIPKLLVLVNPHEKTELAPLVRFEALNGFSVRHGNIKGAWRTNIKDAVEDYNGSVERALKRLRLSAFTPETFPLASCPGIETAWHDWQLANPPVVAPAPPEFCPCGACTSRREASKAHDAGKAERERRRKPGAGLSPLLALLAMSGLLEGLLDDEKGPNGEEPMLLDAMPEMAELLGSRGLLHRTGPNSAVVAIPRKWGAKVIEELEKAIRAGDVERVRAFLSGRTV